MEKDNSLADPSLKYDSWAQHYSLLGLSQRKDPMDALMDLCTIKHLFDVRQELWLLLMASMYSSTLEGDSRRTKGDWVFFFQTLHELFELAYRIRELVEAKKLTYQYHHDE